jgi:hypothetical protein
MFDDTHTDQETFLRKLSEAPGIRELKDCAVECFSGGTFAAVAVGGEHSAISLSTLNKQVEERLKNLNLEATIGNTKPFEISSPNLSVVFRTTTESMPGSN